MNEPAISLNKLIAYTLWAATMTLLLGGWAAYIVNADMAIMLATSACLTGLGASTMTIRCYAARVARLVRVVGGLPTDRTLSAVRD